MKIAYLLGAFPVLSETFIVNEIIELKKLGLDIVVFSYMKLNENFVHKEAIQLARETIYLPKSKFNRAFIYLYAHLYFLMTDPLRYMRILRFSYNKGLVITVFKGSAFYALALKRLKVGHIHSHFAGGSSEVAMMASMLSGIPYSFTVHAHDLYLDSRLTKEQIEFASFVISKTEYNKRFIRERYPGVSAFKLRMVHYGVDLERFSPVKFDEGRDEKFVILSVGRLVEIKGHRYLLEACNILLKRGITNFTCTVVGDGPLKADLEKLARDLDLTDFVQFVGPLPSDKVILSLEDADVFVLPCVVATDGNMDGMPNVLIEAMASGKPVISTFVSGIPELIKDGTGIVVKPENSKALAEAIEEVYLMDLEARQGMGQKGREIVEREFDLENECKKLRDLFVNSIPEIDRRPFNSPSV